MRWILLSLLPLALPVQAEIYAYNNADGDYVVSQSKPEDRNIGYTVLSDDGEFIRMVPGKSERLPISHWRPFWMPEEPNPLSVDPNRLPDPEPVITVEESP